jgi:CRISPR-associated protein Cmr5
MPQTTERSRPTLDQRRAQHAWRAVLKFARTEGEKRVYGDDANKYAGEAKRLPIRIMAAGLGQALAFLLAKAKDKKPSLQKLHEDLTDWVIQERPMKAAVPRSLMESIVAGDSDFLRRATDETLAYLLWLNRFAEAEGLGEDQQAAAAGD